MGKQTELVARRKDGSEVVVEIALSPLQDHGLPLVVAAIRDIGAYPRMKQALQRAHYSEHLAQLGRLAVDTRDPQVLLDHVPVRAAAALNVDMAIVYLLEKDQRELRVASAVGLGGRRAAGRHGGQSARHVARLRPVRKGARSTSPTIGARRASRCRRRISTRA